MDIVVKNDKSKLSSFFKKEKTPGLTEITISLKGEKRNRSFRFSVQCISGARHRYLLNWNVNSKASVNTYKNDSPTLQGNIFDQVFQPVLMFTPSDNKIAYANTAAFKAFNFTDKDIGQIYLQDLVDPFQTTKSKKRKTLLPGTYVFTKKNERNVLLSLFISNLSINKSNYHLVFVTPAENTREKNKAVLGSRITPANRISESTAEINYESNWKKEYEDLSDMINNTPEIFFKLDTNGNFIFVSAEFEKVLGYTPDEVEGKHFTSVIHQDDLPVVTQGFADIYQFGRAKSNIVVRAIKTKGDFEWFSISAVFVYDKDGKPKHCVGSAQQMTETKELLERLEAAEERYAAFINHSSEAIWRFETPQPLQIHQPEEQLIKDFINKGYLAECNDQMAKLYGFEEAADIKGAPLTRFFSIDDPDTLNYFRGFVQSGFKLVNIETHEKDIHGNEKIFLNNLMGIVKDEQLTRVWGTQRDITEQRLVERQAKDQLEQSKNFFKSLISDSLDGIVVLDSDGVTTYAAESITNVLGYLPKEVIGRNCFEFIHPEDLALAIQAFSDESKNVRTRYLELRFQAKEGDWLWMLVRARNLYQHPSVKGMVVYFTNIDQRKHTENVLKESEKRFRHLADTVPVMIWVSDENNRPTYVSKCWSDFTGISLEKIIYDGWGKFIHPDDYQIVIEQHSVHFKRREPFVLEYRKRSKDGSYKWVLDHGIPRFTADGVYIGYIGSVIDIHYRKSAEQKLRYQERMIENIRDAIVSTDLDSNIIAWNNMAEEIYGLKKEEVMGKAIRSVLRHEYISSSQENVLIELYENDSWNGEAYYDRTDGKRIYLLVSLSFVKNEKGQRIGLVGIHRDISQRYEAEMALRISEERYRSVVDALTEGILLQNSHGKIIACNRSARLILGNDLVGSTFETQQWRWVTDNGIPFLPEKDPLTITLKTGKALQGLVMGLQRPGNSLCWFSVNTEPIYYSGQPLLPDAVVTSFFDVTERKHQEEWLSLEKDVLEVNARPSASLKDTIDFYLRGIERMFPDMICSVLMLREDNQSIQHLSGPSLPVEYSSAINGVTIGPKAGSCGTAMFLKQRIVTPDINKDPLWENCKHVALRFNLHSCWSFPIINAQNQVLATIAAYHKYPKAPTEKELRIMEVACNLLKVIFENKKTEADLRLSNERYLLATKATHDAIYDWDLIENTVFRGESFYDLFGYKRDQVGGLFEFLEEKLHPGDKNKVMKSLKQFIDNKRPDIWECEYRFLNATGKYVVVYDRGFLIFSQEGKITRLVGSMMDITERKELEKKLVKQEVDKQKLVAQAVVNAQEKERAEIGKELHDNVNQILSTARLYLELAKNDDKERMNLIKRSYDNIYDAINEIRNISRSLVPPSIGDLGLIESIQDLVENIRATKKLYIEFCYEGDIDQLLGQKQKLMLFRIIQEQVNNVLKHANARNIIIELMIDGSMINLAVSDDGKGFDYQEMKNNKGVGLQNIASRTELFNGQINIVTAPDKGCKLNIHVPISKL
jgi:PAS domain S-box-containing protein